MLSGRSLTKSFTEGKYSRIIHVGEGWGANVPPAELHQPVSVMPAFYMEIKAVLATR